MAETESFCGKIWVGRGDKNSAHSSEPQREAEVKVIASKHGVFHPCGWEDNAGWL